MTRELRPRKNRGDSGTPNGEGDQNEEKRDHGKKPSHKEGNDRSKRGEKNDNRKAKDNGTDDPPGTDTRSSNPRTELVIEHTPVDSEGKILAKEYYTWDVLVLNLRKQQQAQANKRVTLQKWLDEYKEMKALEDDAEAKRALYQTQLDVERAASATGHAGGRAKPTKDAKALWTAAAKKADRVKGARSRFSSKNRKEARDKWSMAQWQLEDFLYYQEVIRRWKRRRAMHPYDRQAEEAQRLRRRTAYMLDSDNQEGDHSHWMHSMLEMYDHRGVGDSRYRMGQTDRYGNPIPGDERPAQPVVGPDELHLWTPRYRRQTAGLPTRINTVNGLGMLDENGEEMFEYANDHDGDELVPLDFALDLKAIEKRRLQIEREVWPEAADDPDMIIQTHELRRAREVA
jgi:hypothetical protein